MMRKIYKIGVFICIFLLGYIEGSIGIGKILENVISKVTMLDWIEVIGVTSSVITLVLFIAYIVGKIFLIKQMENTLFENITLGTVKDFANVRVVAEYNVGGNNNEVVYLFSSQTLRWIKIFEYQWDEKKEVFKKGNLVVHHKYLKNNFAIQINTYLPCSIPAYIVEYERYDFIRGRLDLVANGKNGVMEEGIKLKHNKKSMLYYLVK